MIALDIELALDARRHPGRARAHGAVAGLDDRLDDRRRAARSCASMASPRRRTAAGRGALFGEDARRLPALRLRRRPNELAEFGSTACKALWRCRACREPFDLFKCH